VLQLGSPSGEIKGASIDQPQAVTGTDVRTTLTPEITTEQMTEMGQTQSGSAGGGGLMELAIGGIILVVCAIFIIPLLLRRKKKK